MADEFKSIHEIEKMEKTRKRKTANQSSEVLAMLKNTLVMVCIALVAGGVLGLVYEVTKDPIAQTEALAKQNANRKVFMLADHFSESVIDDATDFSAVKEAYPKVDITDCLEAYDSENILLGYVIEVTTHEGFNGDVVFSMGISADGSINGISITASSESPGLGDRAEEVISPQFRNRNELAFEVTKTGATSDNQIDAITSATITSKAVTNGVNAALVFFRNNLNGGVGNEK